ncbi:MAG: hypothetical protein ACYC9S_04870 [Leptospirales bacterium]
MIKMQAGYRAFATKIVSTTTPSNFLYPRRAHTTESVLLLLVGAIAFFLIVRH